MKSNFMIQLPEYVWLCRGSCFFGYTAENGHHQARIISKNLLFQEEKIPARKPGQIPSKFGEIIKKLISAFGEKPTRGLPKPPPTPPRPASAAFTHGENVILGTERGIHLRD
jgi:hypothetical protein